MSDESKPASKIPDFMHGQMHREVEKDLDKFVAKKFDEWNANERKRHSVEVSGPQGMPPTIEAPKLPTPPSIPSAPQTKIPMVAVDGHVLPGDTVTMMLYSLVTLAKKDKKIAKLLRSFKFVMRDVNGDVIWK
jgi:hypothetical protein